MKILIYSFYAVSVFLIAVALLGGTASKPLIDGYSAKTIKLIGVDKTNIDSMDVMIDNSIYNMNLMMYKIEKYKNTLLLREDNSKPVDLQHYKYIYNSVYVPIQNFVTYILRFIIAFTGIFIFIITALIHSISSYFSLRNRVSYLEQRLKNLKL
jgi:hypothetical protein